MPLVAPQRTCYTAAIMQPGPTSASLSMPPRTHETVPLVCDSPLSPFVFPWQTRPTTHNLVVAVKATFDLVPDRPAVSSQEQLPPCPDQFYEGPGSSLKYASDFAVFKPKTDVMLVGHAYPADNPTVAAVQLTVGPLRRTLAVFGDRTWGKLGAQSKPAAFERMPLRWERAMGGPLSDLNPIGRGFKTGVLLPNIERTDALVSSAKDTPLPACFGPLPPEWKWRSSKLGTFHSRWVEERWPYFPADFDYAFFNAAPPEQQIPFLKGDESYAMIGVRPAKAVLQGALPGLQPRAFAFRTQENAFFEVKLNLDTLFFDADQGKAAIVWRGLLTVQDEEATDISTVFFTTTRVGEPLSPEQARERYAATTRPEEFTPLPTLPVSLPAIALPPAPARSQIMLWIQSHTSLRGKDLSGADLSQADLRGIDLSDCILLHANLEGARLEGANLSGAVLAHAHASRACFDGCNLSGANLAHAALTHASFRNACLTDANLWHVEASGSCFDHVQAQGVVLAKSTLHQGSFQHAHVPKGDFTDCALDHTRWHHAHLEDARFYEAKGIDCSFEGALLTHARLDHAHLIGADLRNANAEESTWEHANLQGASFHGAQITRANFSHANLKMSVLSMAVAKEAFFRKANLQDAHLLKTNLMQANFEGADLQNADLRGANCYQVETWKAKMTGALLDLAIVAGSKLEKGIPPKNRV
ncbi:MAG TPA: DUF2169 domain-containing protein [Polyangiaceae bacterium]|nr:DUF2169 domain-containing protein [Polyangiaceae bacterium]HOD23549.1 DUF2169 domain-containing protein [Polyangiaceae bacterium]HOE51066.1 DUF2169 domain-containing protein [Polyangiaceae bacterium]HOH00228.1 DUF2169 domain-containing protein [Polyangiaceae bacterium]HOR33866.1 DUF2169 domain-containing protein [Polyangiaceae bacterium]